MSGPDRVTVRAAAKINLHLAVGAARADGFHPLVTVYQAISLYDDLELTAADDWTLALDGDAWLGLDRIGPTDDNLVTRAALVLGRHHGRRLTGHAHLAKSIPIAAGLAGGSADAAAALVALDRLHDLRTPDDDLLALAAELGSDVPFALLGGTALGTGRGELVEPVEVPDTQPGTWWVVVPSDTGLSTPSVYAHHDRLRPDAPAEPVDAEELLATLSEGDAYDLATLLHNDLQAAAIDLRPELGVLIDAGEAAGALRGLVSGSGPTVLFCCADGDHARMVAATLLDDEAAHDAPAVLVAHSPVAGAHVLTTAVPTQSKDS